MYRTPRMFVALLLACAVFAPSVYIGFMPIHEARAQGTGYGESKYSPDKRTTGGSAAAGGGKTVASCGLAALFGQLLGNTIGFVGSILPEGWVVMSHGVSVPSHNTNGVEISSNITTSANTTGGLFKDCVIDGILWWIKEMLIDYITRDIIAWINNGFEGAPAFMTDPKSFFRGVMDDAFRTFLYSPEMDALLCKPFKVTVQMNLWLNYTSNHKNSKHNKLSCSLDEFFSKGIDLNVDINTNTQEKYSKLTNEGSLDFKNGGFGAVLALFDDSNNWMGASLLAEREAMKRANAVRASEGLLIQVGDGWFSQRCDANQDGVYNGNVCTPGRFIAEQVDRWTGSALENLTVADEVAEIVNALFAALVREIFGYANGLLSFGGSDNDDWWDDASSQNIIDPNGNRDDFNDAHSSSTYATTTAMTVSKAGTGSGTITSSPPGINCGDDCSEHYMSGTVITLTATPASGSSFVRWSGACEGAGVCSVLMSSTANNNVVATFNGAGVGGDADGDGINGGYQNMKEALLKDIDRYMTYADMSTLALLRELRTQVENVNVALPSAGTTLGTLRQSLESIVGGAGKIMKDNLIASINAALALWEGTVINIQLQVLLEKVETASPDVTLMTTYRSEYETIVGGRAQALKDELAADIQKRITEWLDTSISLQLQMLLSKVRVVDVSASNATDLLALYREDLGDILASAGT